MTRLPIGLLEDRGFMSLRGGDFCFLDQVQTGFWQIQHPIRRGTGVLLAGVSDRGITLDIYICSVPKDKKSGSYAALRWPGVFFCTF